MIHLRIHGKLIIQNMVCPKIKSETLVKKEEKINEFHEDRQVNIHDFRDHGWLGLAGVVSVCLFSQPCHS